MARRTHDNKVAKRGNSVSDINAVFAAFPGVLTRIDIDGGAITVEWDDAGLTVSQIAQIVSDLSAAGVTP